MQNARKILLLLLFISMGFIVPLSVNIVEQDNLNTKISQDYYSDHAVAFFANHTERTDVEELLGLLTKGDILYGEIERYVRGVYCPGKENFPIINGRDFNDTDFFNNKKVALIGQNLQGACQLIDSKYYYSYQGERYEVIGVLGMQTPQLIG